MTFALPAGAVTPWRVVTVARSDAELADRSGLPAIFASPNRLKSAGWIRPGKAIRVRVPYTNERAFACIDFARRRKLAHIEFDAHWYGDGTDPGDATVPIAGLDMERIVQAARAAGIGVILYVDRVPAMRQLDAILRTYRAWGVAGIKFGFMWEGRQQDTRFIHHLVAACGAAGLMVSLHDDLRPAGLERTWPHYVALEGVRGNEHFPTARHNVTLPFTRCVAGPIDYTICYAQDRNLTTNAHQLAAAVVYYSPLAFLYWYDEPEKFNSGQWNELIWFDECPTTWDESHMLSGRIGEHAVVARRSGARWFVGAMTNDRARRLHVPLAFLGAGLWTARIFADGVPAGMAWRTPVTITEREVGAADMLELTLAPSGGAAIQLSPA
jgi:alpha-glucosidase